MNNLFDWSLVQSFLAVMQHGTLQGAARQLQMSQPTMGRHIEELEKQWGVALFERTGRGLVPTTIALQLAESAKHMQSGANQLGHTLMNQQQSLQGTVRISASQPVACYLLLPILQTMRTHIPEVQVELVVTNSVSNLLQREADIALRMVQPEQDSLVAKKVGEISFAACAHQQYLARKGVPQNIEELLQLDLIGQDQDEDILRAFAHLGVRLNRAHFCLRTDDLIAAWQAVRAGLGVGFVSNYVMRTDPEVVPLLTQLEVPTMPIWLVVHREIRGNVRLRKAYDYLAQELYIQLKMNDFSTSLPARNGGNVVMAAG
jgi:DNA-binding transcriptional LysR family regulator